MKSNFLRCLFAALIMSMLSFSAWAGNLIYTYAQSNELYLWGATSPQTYDIAIKLDSSFAGMKVSTISVPVLVTDKIGDFKVWMTSKLAIEDVDGKKVNRTDILCEEMEPIEGFYDSLGYLIYELPEAYAISEEGLYVGYSFTVQSRGDDYEQYPVLVSVPGTPGGLYIHTSKTYRAWVDRAEEIDAVAAIQVSLETDISGDAVGLSAPKDLVAPADKPYQHPVTISNRGVGQVDNIGYTLTIDGTPYQGEYVFKEPIANVFNRKATALIDIPALEVGIYDYTLEITTVNGKPNGDKAVAEGHLHALEVMPVKRPLMEEFTGTWCGWCPRGWVAMEKMRELHPDFVAVAYHNSDAMEIPNYPHMENGYPSAMMDRIISCDPYAGTSNQPFGINQLWEELSYEFSPAELILEATKSADGATVTVTSDVYWAINAEEGSYQVEYVLVGDGLSDNTWIQSNSYANMDAESAGIYLDIFCKGGEYGKSRVVGLVYNDVALINSGGKGVEGSVENLTAGSHNHFTYTFDLSESAVIDKAQSLRVVAMILKDNGRFGRVINSNKAEVVAEADGIEGLSTSSEIVASKYYDLTGREVANPENGGLYLRSVRYSDGRVETSKILK